MNSNPGQQDALVPSHYVDITLLNQSLRTMQKAELCAGLGNHSRCLQGLAFYDLVLRFVFFFFWFNRKDKLFPHHATILYLDQSSIQSLVCSHQCFASLKVLLLSTGSAQRTCPRKE